MNVMEYKGPVDIVVIGIAPGEMLLETIEKAIKEKGIRNGAVVSGIGTLKTCQMHHIEHTHFPPDDRFFTLEMPLELLSVSGLIANGKPHLHIVVSYKDEQTYGGHLEPESEVLYLAEIAIMVFNDLKMDRFRDEERQVSLLGPAK